MTEGDDGTLSDDRYATQRSAQLARELDLRRPEAYAVAYSERGYSHSGMAKPMDTSEGTVSGYLERATVLYGFEIAETHVPPGAELPSYERVDADYYRSRERTDQLEWLDRVKKYEGKLSQEFVNAIEDAAREDGVWGQAIR